MSGYDHDNRKIIKATAAGISCAIVIDIILTLVFAFIIKMMSGIPYGVIDYVTTAAEGFSILLGAYIAGAIAKGKGLIIGASCGCVMLLIVFACGLSTAENDIGIMTPIKCAVIIICGLIGGIAGVNRKEKVRIK